MRNTIAKWLRQLRCSAPWLAAAVVLGHAVCVSAGPAQPMSFRHLTVADGLSQNTVMDVLQDSRGYIWLATENGLDRYDGYDLNRYQRGKSSDGELVNDYVWQIAESEDSNLWLATYGGGLAFWNRQEDRFRHFRHDPRDPNSLSSDYTRTLLVSRDGIWVGTSDSGLNLVDPADGKVTRFRHDTEDPHSLPGDAVFSLLQEASGRLWVGTDDGLAWRDPGSTRFTRVQHDPGNPHSLSDNRIRALYQDRRGAIWVGTYGGGINKLNRRSGRFSHINAANAESGGLSHNHVRAIYEDDAGRLWVGTANGLNVKLPDSKGFVHYSGGHRKAQLSGSYIMSLYQDRGGALWVGTRTGGVNIWNSSSWEFGHFKEHWLEQHSVTSFASDRSGYWVGTFGGGLTRINEVNSTITHIDTESERLALNDPHVMSLLTDRQGGLWVGTMKSGVNWLQSGDDQFTVLRHDPEDPNSLSANGAMSLFEDSSGDIWIGTFGGGVTRFQPEQNRYTRYQPRTDDSASLCGSQGRAFAEDRFGGIWIATENGLCVLEPDTGMFVTFRHDDTDSRSLAANSIYALHIDATGRLWVGTDGGGLNVALGELNDPKSIQFETYSRRDGISSNMVYAVLSARDGMVWLSGNNGLSRLDPKTRKVRNFRSTHGLQGEEYHYGASHQSADGRLFFGGANGFNVFDPRKLNNKKRPPQILLTAISTMNRPLQLEHSVDSINQLELDHGERVLNFEFAVLDFTDPHRNRYSYRLDGFDHEWINAGTRRTATYTNLDGGRYVFRVKGATSDGVWSEETATIELNVAQAPWNTPWAYAAYLLITISAFGYYIRAQKRELKRKAEYGKQLRAEVRQRTQELEQSNHQLQRLSNIKSEFLARMSHEIRSPMNGVLGMAELLTRTSLSEKQKKYADTIINSGESLLQIINDVLDYSKLDSEKLELDEIETDLERLLEDTLTMFTVGAHKKGLELVGVLPVGGLPMLKLDTLRLRQVLVNLLNNAIKFTSKGHIKLTIAVLADTETNLRLEFQVSDTGIGVAPESQQKIFETFVQEDGSTTRRFGGTGLGLTISKELIELMGGTLKLESDRGLGSRFSFALTLAKADNKSLPEPLPKVKASALVACSGEARQPIEEYLSAWGVRCQCVPTGYAMIETLSKAAGRSKDLLIVDAQLTDMPGTVLIEQMRSRGLLKAAHAILLTAIGSDEIEISGSEISLLAKPVRRSELHDLVLSVLGQGKGSPITSADNYDSMVNSNLKGKVLLVEDNPVNQEVIAGMLAEIGCEAEYAEDGLSGVQMAAEVNYDAVLMDIQLPDIDGAEATRRIRSLEAGTERMPIIALTANVSKSDREYCRNAGMDDFLSKPCTIEALSNTLSRWLPARSSSNLAKGPAQEESQFDELALARIRKLKRQDGSDMLSHAVSLFFRLAVETLDALEKAVTDDDAATLRFAAHKLKSSCANLGIVNMADLCRELEGLAHSGSTAGAGAIVEKLRTQHTAVVAWLEEQISDSA